MVHWLLKAGRWHGARPFVSRRLNSRHLHLFSNLRVRSLGKTLAAMGIEAWPTTQDCTRHTSCAIHNCVKYQPACAVWAESGRAQRLDSVRFYTFGRRHGAKRKLPAWHALQRVLPRRLRLLPSGPGRRCNLRLDRRAHFSSLLGRRLVGSRWRCAFDLGPTRSDSSPNRGPGGTRHATETFLYQDRTWHRTNSHNGFDFGVKFLDALLDAAVQLLNLFLDGDDAMDLIVR